jgi:hypothetical protein
VLLLFDAGSLARFLPSSHGCSHQTCLPCTTLVLTLYIYIASLAHGACCCRPFVVYCDELSDITESDAVIIIHGPIADCTKSKRNTKLNQSFLHMGIEFKNCREVDMKTCGLRTEKKLATAYDKEPRDQDTGTK